MENNQIIIPEGWTYYAHRTNTERWKSNPFTENVIKINKIMSVITESEIYQELKHYGENYLHSYTNGQGEPFEIRCLICDLHYLQTLDNEELKNIMLKEFYYDKRNLGGCYGQRHHSIPEKEELVVLGIGNYDEVFNRSQKIIWTIPKRFINFYKDELKKNSVRTVFINQVTESKKK